MISDSAIRYLTMGTLLGLTAGISPGPLLTLVITQTLKHNRADGIKVAISPLITDLPIILLSLFIFDRLSQFDMVLAIIAFAGGAFVAHLGIDSITSKGLNLEVSNAKAESLKKGIIANFLSPHPYLYWATVGTPILFKAYGVSLLSASLYIISFYLLLVGSKIGVAILVSRTKAFINQKAYVIIMRILGVILLVFSVMFFYDGLKYLKLV